MKESCVKTNRSTIVRAAFDSFKQWAEVHGEYYKRSERWFGLRMAQLGFKSEVVHGQRIYRGFEVAADRKEQEAESRF